MLYPAKLRTHMDFLRPSADELRTLRKRLPCPDEIQGLTQIDCMIPSGKWVKKVKPCYYKGECRNSLIDWDAEVEHIFSLVKN